MRRWYNSLFKNTTSWVKLPLEIKTFILSLALDDEDVLIKMSLYMKLTLVSKEFKRLVKIMKPPLPFEIKRHNRSFEATGWREFLLKKTWNEFRGYSDLIDPKGNVIERDKVFLGCGDYLLLLESSLENIESFDLVRATIYYKGVCDKNLEYNGIIGKIPFFRLFSNYVSITSFGLMFLIKKNLLVLKNSKLEVFKENVKLPTEYVTLGYNGLYVYNYLYSFNSKPLLTLPFLMRVVITGTPIDLVICGAEKYFVHAIKDGKVLWKGGEVKNLKSLISCVGNLVLIENKILLLTTGEVLYHSGEKEILAATQSSHGHYILHVY